MKGGGSAFTLLAVVASIITDPFQCSSRNMKIKQTYTGPAHVYFFPFAYNVLNVTRLQSPILVRVFLSPRGGQGTSQHEFTRTLVDKSALPLLPIHFLPKIVDLIGKSILGLSY